MHFTKMQGAGNDFIILDNRDASLSGFSFPALATALCPRRLSVGADGLMVILPAREGCDFSMEFYNQDGSLGEMCGNGARCLTRYGLTHGLCREQNKVYIHTTAGMVTGYAADAGSYTVKLNDPGVYIPHMILSAEGQDWDCAYMELGSPGLPHLILPLSDDRTQKQSLPYPLARALRSHPALPRGANVNFYRLLEDHSVALYTFERGVEDFTLACGTGAGAAAAHLAAAGLQFPEGIVIHAPGGTLQVSLTLSCHRDLCKSDISCSGAAALSAHLTGMRTSESDCTCAAQTIHDIFLTGPALFVAEGEISTDILR